MIHPVILGSQRWVLLSAKPTRVVHKVPVDTPARGRGFALVLAPLFACYQWLFLQPRDVQLFEGRPGGALSWARHWAISSSEN